MSVLSPVQRLQIYIYNGRFLVSIGKEERFMPKQIDFDSRYNEIMDALKNDKSIVFCTSNGDKVAARTVFFALHNDCIYFMTSTAYPKYKQICKNPNVALCLQNIQIEGIANIKGHPSLEENKGIVDSFTKACPENNRYIHHKNTVLIEIKITKVQTWREGVREYIDFIEKSAYSVG